MTEVKKRQFELSDSDIEFLGARQYQESAWEAIGRRHGVDATTRVALPNSNNRAFLAEPKRYLDPLPVVGGIVTTQTINNVAAPINIVPIPASGVRDELRKRDLTKPVSTETSTEDV